MLLGAQGEGVHVDARVGAAGVVLERLDLVEVGALALREAVLAVKLELGSDHGVLAPAVHVEGGLRKNEGAGIGHIGAGDGVGGGGVAAGSIVLVERRVVAGSPLLGGGKAWSVVNGAGILE